MNAYLLALEIEPVNVGTGYSSLPLHCTIMHWFLSLKGLNAIVDATKDIITMSRPITLVSKRSVLFGPNSDVPVNILARNEARDLLHLKLFRALNGIGVVYTEPGYVGDGYSAHVTTQKGGAFAPGTSHVAKSVYLVEALPDGVPPTRYIGARLCFSE
ncbi:MAG: hypothetical protein AAB421_02370 [Patescibacteria group bacterium]